MDVLSSMASLQVIKQSYLQLKIAAVFSNAHDCQRHDKTYQGIDLGAGVAGLKPLPQQKAGAAVGDIWYPAVKKFKSLIAKFVEVRRGRDDKNRREDMPWNKTEEFLNRQRQLIQDKAKLNPDVIICTLHKYAGKSADPD